MPKLIKRFHSFKMFSLFHRFPDFLFVSNFACFVSFWVPFCFVNKILEAETFQNQRNWNFIFSKTCTRTENSRWTKPRLRHVETWRISSTIPRTRLTLSNHHSICSNTSDVRSDGAFFEQTTKCDGIYWKKLTKNFSSSYTCFTLIFVTCPPALSNTPPSSPLFLFSLEMGFFSRVSKIAISVVPSQNRVRTRKKKFLKQKNYHPKNK